MIYLDNNATTRPCKAAVDAVRDALEEQWANPSSVHREGQNARNTVEIARRDVAALLGLKPSEITFTSGATESIWTAHRGALLALPEQRRTVISSLVEHEAVRDSLQHLSGPDGVPGAKLINLNPKEGGLIDPGELKHQLEEHRGAVGLVSIQWANNETGAIQPVREIGALARQHNALFHCDATQWVGKYPTAILRPTMTGDIDLNDQRPWIDLVSCSAHKFHGPKGIGALAVRRGVGIRPAVTGSQEKGRRGGTEAVPLIAGMGAAAREASAWLDGAPLDQQPPAAVPVAKRRDRLTQSLIENLGAIPNQPADPTKRLWNTANLGFKGLEAEALLLLMSERGLAASAGAACSSGSLDPSPVLLAMGVPEPVAHGSIRLSLSRNTTDQEIDQAIEIITAAVNRLRQSANATGPATH